MLKVLVVDDEMPIRQWLEFCIGKIEGVELAGAASHGAEGFSMFRKSHPDVVITDIRMPVMDGLEMIRMIQNLNPSVYAIVLTSFEDFEYARKAMSLGASEYILKTEISDESLRASLEKAARAIGRAALGGNGTSIEDVADRNYLLRSMVQGDVPVPCREAVLDEYGVRLKNGPFFAFNVCMEKEGDMIHRPKNGFLQNSMKFPVDSRNVMIVGNVGKEYGDGVELRNACRDYVGEILDQTSCWVGISDLRTGRERLSESMMEAYRRSGKHFYRPKEKIFATGSMWNWDMGEEEKYKILFSKNLISQNMEKAVKVKDQALEQVEREEPLKVEAVKQLFGHFMMSILHATKEEVERVEEDVRRLKESLEQCPSMEELRQLVNRFFEERGVGREEEKEYSQAVRRAIAFMEENYGTSIALTDVAAHVGLSPEYLSRLFKEDTGLKFVVWLNNLRLKHAIYLLENTNLKVYEVAEKVGYSNLSYFSTVFKKNFGQNPFDYKNSMAGTSSR